MNRRDRIKLIVTLPLSFLLLLTVLLPTGVSPLAFAEEEGSEAELLPDAPETAEEAGEAENAEETDDWETRLLLMLQKRNANPDTIAAGYYNFATGEEHYYNGDEYRVSGSMYKVPLNMLFMDWISEGKLTMDELISGYRYSELLEGTIVNSDNNYAKILWDYAGATIETDPPSTLYHRYRILIAPLMGEDPENVDDKYYENNFFTPRQMITCLRRLYDGGSRYDRLIETMQRAEPEKYFKLHERRYDIAHKYGWFAEDPILYLNDCALCFTDDPIAIVLFTTGTENAYGVLADYCTLMCEYAQETHEKRLRQEQAEAEAIAAAEERDRLEAERKAKEEEIASPDDSASPGPEVNGENRPASKPAAEQVKRGFSAGPALALALVMGFSLVGIIWFSLRHRTTNLALQYAIAAVVLTAFTCMLCLPGVSGNSYIVSSGEDPADTVEAFFRALTEGDYAAADGYLANGASLGLSGSLPSDTVRGAAMEALERSWSYRLLGNSSVEKTSAWQELQLQVLDFDAMTPDLERETREQLLAMGRTMARSQIYDENGNCLPEAAALAYDRAMEKLLETPQNYYSSVGLRIQLVQTRDGWKIVPTEALLRALSGNPD